MLFPTVRFALFFMATWAAVVAVRHHPRMRRWALLLASWVFYAAWNWRFLGLLWALIGFNHLAARLVATLPTRRRRQMALGAGIAADLCVLGWFKYYGFFTESLVGLFDRLGWSVAPPLIQVALPLGISFLTFEAVSYLIEVHRGVIEPVGLIDEAVWLSFFPTVVSGPITRASELVPQLRAVPACDDPAGAIWLILRGLAKKVVVASYLGSALVEDAFASPDRYSGATLLLAVYAYGAQIYVDFSGYTDIAIGTARLLGYRLPENFDRPYAASSIREFWRRWHSTLTRWLRDFVFTPMGLRWGRRPILSMGIPLVVMLLAGLWHGAAWTFVAFGAVHGVALSSERWRRQRRRHRQGSPVPDTVLRRLVRHVVTLHVVSLGWLFFRAESLGDAGTVSARILTAAPGVRDLPLLTVATVVGVVAVQFVPPDWARRAADAVHRLRPAAQIASVAAALTVIDVLGPAGVAPFIYFQF